MIRDINSSQSNKPKEKELEGSQKRSERLPLIDAPDELIRNLQQKTQGNKDIHIDLDEIKKKYTTKSILQQEGEIGNDPAVLNELYINMVKRHPHEVAKGELRSISLCVNAGCFCGCDCCTKSKLDSLGVGMVIYFKLLRALILCFFITSIFSLPLYCIYSASHPEKPVTNYMDLLFKSTIGNIGSTIYNCEKYPLATFLNAQQSLDFKCGDMSISSVIHFGAAANAENERYNNQNCFNSMTMHDLKIDDGCKLTKELDDYVKANCLNKNDCPFVYDMTTLKSSCSPKSGIDTLYISYSCYESIIPSGIPGKTIERNTFGFVVVVLDLLCIITIMITLWCIDSKHKKEFQRFIEEKTYIRDFTLHLTNIRVSKEELDKEIEDLMKHFNKILADNDAEEYKLQEFQVRENRDTFNDYTEKINSFYQPNNYFIYELLYPKLTWKKLDGIKKCNKIQKKIHKLESKHSNTINENEKLGINSISTTIKDPKIEKLEEKLTNEKHRINTETDITEVKEFYITFRNHSIAKYLEKKYSLSQCKRCCLLCCKKEKIEKYYYKDKWLDINFAKDEPTNIKWENMTYSPCKRCCRKTISIISAVIMVLITLAAILVTKYFEQQLSDDYNTTVDCNYFKNTPESDVVTEYTDPDKTTKEKVLSYCFCFNKMGVVGVFTNEVKDITFVSAPTIKPCEDFVASYATYTSINIAIIIAIPIVNTAVIMIFRCLTSFERNKTQSKDMSSNMWKIFVIRFLNTGILLLIVNIKIDKITEVIPNFPFFAGNFTDFDPVWYNKVGIVILFSMILDVVTPHLVSLAEVIFHYCFRCCDGCTGGKSTKVKTKEEYFDIYTGPEFLIDARYSSMLSSFFIVMLFSSGIPLLYLIFFLYISFIYLMDKLLVLKFYRNPPKYDLGIIAMYNITSFVAILVHFLFGIWIYGNPLLLVDGTPNKLNGVKELIENLLQLKSTTGQIILARLTLGHNLIYLIAFLLLIVILVIASVVGCFKACGNTKIKLNKESSIEIGLAISMKDLYQNYIIKELEYAQLAKMKSTTELEAQKGNLQKGLEYDRALLRYKLEKYKEEQYPELTTNFNQKIMELKPAFSLESKGIISGDISYNMAFIPEFEGAVYYEYLKNL